MAVASLDRRRLVVAVLRRAVDGAASGLGPQGAGGPQGPAVTLVRRQVLVLQVQHRQRHVQVLRLGGNVVRTSVGSARFPVPQVVVDDSGTDGCSDEKAGNYCSDDGIDRSRTGNGNGRNRV